MRVAALLALETLYPELDALADAFAAKGREFDGVMKSGRTHMQDAVPIRLGQEFAAYGVAIRQGERDAARRGRWAAGAGAGRDGCGDGAEHASRVPEEGGGEAGADCGSAAVSGRGFAVGDAVAGADGAGERGAAGAGAGGDPDLRTICGCCRRGRIRASTRFICRACSRGRRLCRGRSIR